MKLTNKQNIDLLNAFIVKNTDYKIEEFTGGSVSNTLTHNNTQIHFKINLYFGYKNKKPITKTIEISEDIYSIMYKAITLKIKSMLKKEDLVNIDDIKNLLDMSIDTSSTPSSDTPRTTPTNTITYYLSTINTNTINTIAFKKWLNYKKYKSIDGVTLSANFLSDYSKEIQEQIINSSIMNGWKGLFEPKQQKKQEVQDYSQFGLGLPTQGFINE
jgi:hypothetical protein